MKYKFGQDELGSANAPYLAKRSTDVTKNTSLSAVPTVSAPSTRPGSYVNEGTTYITQADASALDIMRAVQLVSSTTLSARSLDALSGGVGALVGLSMAGPAGAIVGSILAYLAARRITGPNRLVMSEPIFLLNPGDFKILPKPAVWAIDRIYVDTKGHNAIVGAGSEGKGVLVSWDPAVTKKFVPLGPSTAVRIDNMTATPVVVEAHWGNFTTV